MLIDDPGDRLLVSVGFKVAGEAIAIIQLQSRSLFPNTIISALHGEADRTFTQLQSRSHLPKAINPVSTLLASTNAIAEVAIALLH